MALDSKNNIKSVFIVPANAAVTAGVKVTPGSLALDTVVITDMSNTVLATGTGTYGVQKYDKIKIIKDRGVNNPLQQVVINLNQITKVSPVSGAPATEQVDYIGYDGVNTNTITVASNNFYTVKLEHVPNSFAYGKRPANYKYGTFLSPEFVSPVQTGPNSGIIATGLVRSLITNFRPNRTTDWRVFTELTNSGTRGPAGAAVNMTFTKYSKTVTVVGATATTNVVVGSYVTLGTAKTLGIYKVVDKITSGALSGQLILDVAYQGETVTIAGNVAQVIINANLGVEWGIKITGVKQKYDVNRWRQYDKVRFNTSLDGFPNTTSPTLVDTTAAFDGIAVYEQVANDEYISWGDEGQVFVDQVPPLFREQDARPDTQYSPAVIGWLDRLPSLIGAGENKGQVILYLPGTLVSGEFTVAAGNQTSFVNVFNDWRAGSFPTVATAWPKVV
jgi:hypothetical protein